MMPMAIRVPSPPLEYPDLDVDDDDQDELEAMAEMEIELRRRKQGQVIQHRHVSPPLPSSSQPADSPTKRVLERRTMVPQNEDLLEVEVVSSPPREPDGLQTDIPISYEPVESLRPVTPLTLGGSKFRRKPVVPDSSPLNQETSLHTEQVEETRASVLRSLDRLSSENVASTFLPILETGFRENFTARTSWGKQITIPRKPAWKKVLARQTQRDSLQAQKDSYYGVDIHAMLNTIERESEFPSYPEFDDVRRTTIPSKELWTDKYRATKFVDLLGDERVHRDIMRWLKHWDYCVFGRDIPTSSSFQSRQPNNNDKRKSNGMGAVNAPIVDPYQRPPQRVLMLHGPPGLGKTTLAHVAASLAGYEVLEINASDERSGTAARDRIVEAVETIGIDRSGRRGKERCVILDECDGGDANFVKVLLDLIQADEKAGGPAPKNAKGKKRKPRKPLLRPIICICNDLYATTLRPLRPYCHILHIRPTPPSSLLPRLQKICHLENIKADARALTLLTESHEGDLRSCINSLQLLATKCNNLTLSVIQESLAKAKKEGSLEAHTVVEGIFSRRTAKEKRKLNVAGQVEGQRVVNEVNACGEFDRIMNGCHTHFPTQTYTETHLEKTCEAYEWLHFYDQLQTALYHDQLGECVQYMSYCAQGFHELFSQEKGEGQRTLERKRDPWEAYEKEKQSREIIDSWMGALDGRMKQMFNRDVFAEEFISLVLRIISPDLRPVNEQLISPPERLALFRVVDAMLQTGLRYTQYKVDDGSFVFKLEPAGIENLITFEKETKVIRGRYAVRQLVSREMEREKIRRRKGDLGEVTESRGVKRKAESVDKERKIVERVKKDFFGRLIVEDVANEGKRRRTDSSHDLKIQPSVWVKYHEGYSNAVRKPVVFLELLGRV